MLDLGLEDLWLRAMVDETRHDYIVVSMSIAIAYATVVLGICLAGTHRLLGPIVALRRHLESIKSGDYASRVHLRAGHPLGGIAQDLNELSEMLNRPVRSPSNRHESSGKTPIADQAEKTVDRLLMTFNAEDSDNSVLEPPLVAATG